jgi:hypothetical protein
MNLRYSPVNWLIVDWGFAGRPFSDCALPQPVCASNPPESTPPVTCSRVPIREAIDTYDWERWLPEVIVGIKDPDEEIAANYVREAAIEFCKMSRVLQRELYIELQPKTDVYPLFPYEDERIHGALMFTLDDGCSCACRETRGITSDRFFSWHLDVARNEMRIEQGHRNKGVLRVLIWAAPTEYACAHDQFLYEHWRHDIAQEARRRYATAVHFRYRELLRSLPSESAFTAAAMRAKLRTCSTETVSRAHPSTAFGG